MSNCQKLHAKAQSSAANLRFNELCTLAECFGWVRLRQNGSHVVYENPNLRPDQGRMQNFQDLNGRAKPYQVRLLLNAIENLSDD